MLQEIGALPSQLQAMRNGHINPANVSYVFRQQTTLLDALPPHYTNVLHQLLDRFESSALFAEESCSFSQQGLLDSLQLWLDKAGRQLADS